MFYKFDDGNIKESSYEELINKRKNNIYIILWKILW